MTNRCLHTPTQNHGCIFRPIYSSHRFMKLMQPPSCCAWPALHGQSAAQHLEACRGFCLADWQTVSFPCLARPRHRRSQAQMGVQAWHCSVVAIGCHSDGASNYSMPSGCCTKQTSAAAAQPAIRPAHPGRTTTSRSRSTSDA